jgi:hypothetical protein
MWAAGSVDGRDYTLSPRVVNIFLFVTNQSGGVAEYRNEQYFTADFDDDSPRIETLRHFFRSILREQIFQMRLILR